MGKLSRKAVVQSTSSTLLRALFLFQSAEAKGWRTARKRSTLMVVMRKMLLNMQALMTKTMALQEASPNTQEKARE